MRTDANTFAATLSTAALLSLLAGCGGGAAGGSAITGSTITGVAATGLAISNGTISLKCVSGAPAPVRTGTDGTYSIDVTTATLPCVARVDYTEAATGTAVQLHSLAQAAGNVNITPVTDMVVANLSATGAASDAFDKFDANEVSAYTADRIRTAARTVKTELQLQGVDVADLPDDPIRATLRAADGVHAGDAHDGVLDEIHARLKEQGKTLREYERDMKSGHEGRGLATSTGQAGDAAAGKTAYETNCQGCHGARVPDAVNAAKILEAIRENEGGMGVLGSTITTAVADNIATYIASGAGPALRTQRITFASPGDQVLGAAPLSLTATASSGLPVAITSQTPAVCAVSGTTLTLAAAGKCTLAADQSGNASYSGAPSVVVTFNVASSSGTALAAQAITFASPGPQTVGVAVVLTATADSGLPVTLASTTPSICTVSGSTLTPIAAGNCTVTANQAGNASFAAASQVMRTVIVANAVSTASAANGKALYASNGCGGCHGSVPAALNVLAGAGNATVIQNAIGSNLGGMGQYSGLTSQNLADIAAYLATPAI